jgi:hypothetical protein
MGKQFNRPGDVRLPWPSLELTGHPEGLFLLFGRTAVPRKSSQRDYVRHVTDLSPAPPYRLPGVYMTKALADSFIDIAGFVNIFKNLLRLYLSTNS